jgi:hypothetical protein
MNDSEREYTANELGAMLRTFESCTVQVRSVGRDDPNLPTWATLQRFMESDDRPDGLTLTTFEPAGGGKRVLLADVEAVSAAYEVWKADRPQRVSYNLSVYDITRIASLKGFDSFAEFVSPLKDGRSYDMEQIIAHYGLTADQQSTLHNLGEAINANDWLNVAALVPQAAEILKVDLT